jgi:peptidyl-prolyl cis-trans isomerase C
VTTSKLALTRLLLAAAAGVVAVGALFGSAPGQAGGKVYARIDGHEITDDELQQAQSELGANLAQVPAEQRTAILVQYLIENDLLAAAAEKAGLGTGADFDKRLAYYKSRALRDAYFEKNIGGAVSAADAQAFYNDKVKLVPPVEEVRARHILVKEEQEAKDLAAKIKDGGDFAALAKEKSTDKGSGAQGGDLGFFGKGQMVKPFEDAAWALKAGEVSAPVKSQFGWHLIKLEEKRVQPPPSFDTVKEQIMTELQRKKAGDIMAGLRSKAKIEVLDEAIKKQLGMGGPAPAGADAAPQAE